MQVDVSTSFDTTGSRRTPGAGDEVAETRNSSQGMSNGLRLLQLHQETLARWCKRVRIDNSGRHEVGEGAALLAPAEKAPVDRKSDLVDGLSADLHRLDSPRDHGAS